MAVVISNDRVGPHYYLLRLKVPVINNTWAPGRFLHIKVSHRQTHDPLLRRPLSLFDVNYKNNTVSLLYCLVGRGTQILSKTKANTELDILGPLGQGFSLRNNQEILIIGGGMGIAPLFLLTKFLGKNNNLKIFLGGNEKESLLFFTQQFEKMSGELRLATIDGSLGYQGTVLDLWEEQANDFSPDFIYTCGPPPMLSRIQALAARKKLPGEVSLEERMGCGVGVCLSCVCATGEGNQRVCKEGPVFQLSEVIFDDRN